MSSADAPETRARPRILLVDDEPAVRTMIHAAVDLRGSHYDLVEAGTASEAIARAHADHPDLVLLDVALPDHDGFWVCRELKSSPPTAHIPVIMLTAMSLPTDRERAAEVGADGYVVKPFSPRALLTLLDERFGTQST